MYLLLILIVILFSIVFILKDENNQKLKNLSLLTTILPLILAVLMLISVTYDSGVVGFEYLGVFDVKVMNVPTLIKTFTTISLISLTLYFYSHTKQK